MILRWKVTDASRVHRAALLSKAKASFQLQPRRVSGRCLVSSDAETWGSAGRQVLRRTLRFSEKKRTSSIRAHPAPPSAEGRSQSRASVTKDEGLGSLSLDRLAALEPAFSPSGVCTAANTAAPADGAAALVLSSEEGTSRRGLRPIGRCVGVWPYGASVLKKVHAPRFLLFLNARRSCDSALLRVQSRRLGGRFARARSFPRGFCGGRQTGSVSFTRAPGKRSA